MYNYDEEDDSPACPNCYVSMEWVECIMCNGEGGRDGDDLMEEDPLWYSPNDYERCGHCNSDGGFWICSEACSIQPIYKDDIGEMAFHFSTGND